MAAIWSISSGGHTFFLRTLSAYFPRVLRFQDQTPTPLLYREELEPKINDFASRLKFNKPVKLESNSLISGFAQGLGMKALGGEAIIRVHPKRINGLSSSQREFVLAREVAQIHANKGVWLGLVPGLVGIITTLALSLLFPPLAIPLSNLIGLMIFGSPAAAIGCTVASIAWVVLSRKLERDADDVAFELCSVNARRLAPLIFNDERQFNISRRDDPAVSCAVKAWRKCFITSNGNSRINISQRSLTAREKYFQEKLGYSAVGNP